jgi:hypothetical protein
MSHPASPALKFKKTGVGALASPLPFLVFRPFEDGLPIRPSPKPESPFDRFDYFLALGFFCA